MPITRRSTGPSQDMVTNILRPSETISLTGMRFSGKTEVGKALSERLGIPLHDTDTIFRQQYGTTVQNYVKSAGWRGFRAAECGVILDLFSQIRENAIVSLGGGALVNSDSIYHRNLNLQAVKDKGMVVYLLPSPDLKLSAAILGERERMNGEDNNRPKLPPLETLVERHPLYLAACDNFVVYEAELGKADKSEMIDRKAGEIIRRISELRRK
ncbi:MAG: hypothetical protein KGH94_04050 [Candidatus Micrarchaeota archaeon]|nr:hypothetical protein [Candidatus Micrarchaeota archaeon]